MLLYLPTVYMKLIKVIAIPVRAHDPPSSSETGLSHSPLARLTPSLAYLLLYGSRWSTFQYVLFSDTLRYASYITQPFCSYKTFACLSCIDGSQETLSVSTHYVLQETSQIHRRRSHRSGWPVKWWQQQERQRRRSAQWVRSLFIVFSLIDRFYRKRPITSPLVRKGGKNTTPIRLGKIKNADRDTSDEEACVFALLFWNIELKVLVFWWGHHSAVRNAKRAKKGGEDEVEEDAVDDVTETGSVFFDVYLCA